MIPEGSEIPEPLEEIVSAEPVVNPEEEKAVIRSFTSRIFSLTPDPMCIMDSSFNIVEANSAAENAFQRKCEKIIGRPFISFIDPGDRTETLIQCRRASHEGKSVSFQNRLARKDRETLMDWTAIPLVTDGPILLAGRDMAFMIQQQEQLRMSFAAMESAANGIMITDVKEIIIWVNGAFSLLTGYSREETVGKTPRLIRSDTLGPELYSELRKTIAQGLIWSGEMVNRRPDGTLYSVEETIAPIYNRRGEISHYVAIIQDITQRKEAERIMKEHTALLEREINLAAVVQKSLFPSSLPEVEGYRLAAAVLPAQFVSGDLYDCFLSSGSSIVFSMADISGKGVHAAMLSSSTKTVLRIDSRENIPPSVRIRNMNAAMSDELVNAGMFITLFVGDVDPPSGLVRYANAGHTEALVIRHEDLRCERLPATGIPIGILPDFEYVEAETSLSPGDLLVLYSDGITETANVRGELYGIERLEESARRSMPQDDPRDILACLIADVNAFRGTAALSDDLSLFILKPGERSIPFSMEADLEKIESVVRTAGSAARGYGAEFSYRTELALSEILSNVVRHAFLSVPGTLSGTITLKREEIVMDVFDNGSSFDMESISPPDPGIITEGSYGIHILRRICDEISYTPNENGLNHWHAVKRRTRGTG